MSWPRPARCARPGRPTIIDDALLVLHADLVEHGLRRPVPLRRHVALVTEVGHAGLAGPEAAGDEVAHRAEEADAVAEAPVGLGRIRDVVQHLPLLGVGARHEPLVEAPAAL